MNPPAESLTRAVAELKRQNALLALDREWQRERERLMQPSRGGFLHVPTRSDALLTRFGIGACGTLFLAIGFLMATRGNDNDPATLPMALLHAVAGFLIAAAAWWKSSRELRRVAAYEQAEADYRRRRAALLREHQQQQERQRGR